MNSDADRGSAGDCRGGRAQLWALPADIRARLPISSNARRVGSVCRTLPLTWGNAHVEMGIRRRGSSGFHQLTPVYLGVRGRPAGGEVPGSRGPHLIMWSGDAPRRRSPSCPRAHVGRRSPVIPRGISMSYRHIVFLLQPRILSLTRANASIRSLCGDGDPRATPGFTPAPPLFTSGRFRR